MLISLNPWDAETGVCHEFEVTLGWLHRKFQASKGYKVRPYVKEETIKLSTSFIVHKCICLVITNVISPIISRDKKIARGGTKLKQVQKYKEMFLRKCCCVCRNADKHQFRVNSTHPRIHASSELQ